MTPNQTGKNVDKKCFGDKQWHMSSKRGFLLLVLLFYALIGPEDTKTIFVHVLIYLCAGFPRYLMICSIIVFVCSWILKLPKIKLHKLSLLNSLWNATFSRPKIRKRKITPITRVACSIMVCSVVGLSVARLQSFAFSRFQCGLLSERTMIGGGKGGILEEGRVSSLTTACPLKLSLFSCDTWLSVVFNVVVVDVLRDVVTRGRGLKARTVCSTVSLLWWLHLNHRFIGNNQVTLLRFFDFMRSFFKKFYRAFEKVQALLWSIESHIFSAHHNLIQLLIECIGRSTHYLN